MPQHTAGLDPQPLPAARRRDRVVGSVTAHHQILKQGADRRDPPVHRRRRRPGMANHRHHRPRPRPGAAVCQPTQSNRSTGITSASRSPQDSQNRAKHNTS